MLRMGSFRIGEDLCHTPPRLKRGLSKLDDETVGRSLVGSGLLLDYTQSSQVVLETMEGLSQTPFGSGAKSSPSLLLFHIRGSWMWFCSHQCATSTTSLAIIFPCFQPTRFWGRRTYCEEHLGAQAAAAGAAAAAAPAA